MRSSSSNDCYPIVCLLYEEFFMAIVEDEATLIEQYCYL